MTLRRTRAVYYRGGTSRGLIFRASDLPSERGEWDAVFLAAMGVPDANRRNLDGMGGGLSSLNKVCVVGPSSRADADIDYTFAQLAIDSPVVEYGGNCGNMSAAVGPFAVGEGLVARPPDGEAVVRIHNTNTGKIIVARFPVEGGALAARGNLAIDGVSGMAAPIRLEFLDPGGAKTGRLLPTGKAVDLAQPFRGGAGGGAFPPGATQRDEATPHPNPSPEGEGPYVVEMSCVDAANPCVFVLAESLGKSGRENPQVLEADAGFLSTMEAIRQEGARRMGLPRSASVPLMAMVAPGDGEAHIHVRMISVGQPHRATPITGAVCLAVAARTPGTLPHRLCGTIDGPIRIGHPSGMTQVDAALDGAGRALHGAVYRTARRLFEGAVVY